MGQGTSQSTGHKYRTHLAQRQSYSPQVRQPGLRNRSMDPTSVMDAMTISSTLSVYCHLLSTHWQPAKTDSSEETYRPLLQLP